MDVLQTLEYVPKVKTGIIVNAWFVDLRENATYNSKMISVLKSYDVVDILEKENNFYKVKTKNGQIGFIGTKYLKEDVT